MLQLVLTDTNKVYRCTALRISCCLSAVTELHSCAGQYALAVCDLPTAAGRFRAAEQCSSSRGQARLAAIHGALTLVATNNPQDLIGAAEALQRQQLLADTDADLPFHDRCSHLWQPTSLAD